MAEITAALVKELREKTGAGMMDCKKALSETGGDLEAAVDWLRKKGLAAAAKKAGRVAAEGLVGIAGAGVSGAVVEVNAETDFVARNERFQAFVGTLARLALTVGGDVDALKQAPYPGAAHAVAEELTQLIATIGEHMSVRRVVRLSVDQGVVASYVHNALTPGLGKIGVLVALESSGESLGGSSGNREKLMAIGRQIAMHIAATNPQSLDVAGLDPALLERERAVLIEQARASGKAEEIIARMVEGRVRKFYEEVVLLEQIYVVDGESRVKDIIARAAQELGCKVRLAGFVRVMLGEGIEREETDFAAEVAAQAGR